MGVGIGEIGGGAYVKDFSFIFIDGFEDSRVEYWRFGSRVDSNKQDDVGILDHFDLRVEQIVRAEIVWER